MKSPFAGSGKFLFTCGAGKSSTVGCGGSSMQTRWAGGASLIHVPVSPPLILCSVPISAGISSTSRLASLVRSQPGLSQPWDGQGWGLAGGTGGLLLLQPFPVPRCQPHPAATKGRDTRDRRSNSPQPGNFGDVQGVFIHKERAVTFYSPSGWEYRLCEPHRVCFQWDGAVWLQPLCPSSVLISKRPPGAAEDEQGRGKQSRITSKARALPREFSWLKAELLPALPISSQLFFQLYPFPTAPELSQSAQLKDLPAGPSGNPPGRSHPMGPTQDTDPSPCG